MRLQIHLVRVAARSIKWSAVSRQVVIDGAGRENLKLHKQKVGKGGYLEQQLAAHGLGLLLQRRHSHRCERHWSAIVVVVCVKPKIKA